MKGFTCNVCGAELRVRLARYWCPVCREYRRPVWGAGQDADDTDVDTLELGNAVFGHSRGEYRVPRNEGRQADLIRLFDAYAPDRESSWYLSGVEFENDTFEVHPYCWCERDDCPQCGTGEQPNFRHKPSGYSVQWYKYPLRDSWANRRIAIDEFMAIIDDCIASLASDAAGTGVEVEQ